LTTFRSTPFSCLFHTCTSLEGKHSLTLEGILNLSHLCPLLPTLPLSMPFHTYYNDPIYSLFFSYIPMDWTWCLLRECFCCLVCILYFICIGAYVSFISRSTNSWAGAYSASSGGFKVPSLNTGTDAREPDSAKNVEGSTGLKTTNPHSK
jgi:hypothetical protein